MRLNNCEIQRLNIQKKPNIHPAKTKTCSPQYSYLIYCCLSSKSQKPMNKAGHSLQIRIPDSFGTNGGKWTVPRIHFYLIGEHHQLLLNAGNQLLMVAARQVGAPHTALEQNITANQLPGFRMIKNHAAGRMSGYVQNLELRFTKAQHITLI